MPVSRSRATVTEPAGPSGARVEEVAVERLSTDLAAVLSGWRTSNPAQETLRQDYLEHLERHPGAVLRDGPPEHFTVGCLVLDHSRGQVLLTLHAKAHRWFQLGGHLEPTDADVRAAALREAIEESGIPTDALALHPEPVHLDRHQLVGSFGRCTWHLDVRYAAVAAPGAQHAVSEESLDLAWWPVDALPEDSAHEIRPLVAAALARLG